MDQTTLEQVASALARARSVVVLTGAGVSAESGLATFRDPEEGLWAKYDPMELATIQAFNKDPELVTRWYHWRFTRCVDCKPNPGHHALARIETHINERGGAFTLLTQNIDGLHQAGGTRNIVELHGTILTWRCLQTGQHISIQDIPFDEFPPRSQAGGILRPNVVWFGEELPAEAVETALDVCSKCDLFFSIGTSAAVYPAAGFIDLARANAARTVEINRDPTPISGAVDWSLPGKSGDILPRLAQLAFG